MDFGNIVNNLLNQMAFFHLDAGNYDSHCIRYAAG